MFVNGPDTTLHKRLFLLMGLWPTAYPRLQIARKLIFYLLTLAGLLSELSLLFSPEHDFSDTLCILSIFLTHLIVMIQYISYHLYVGNVRTMFAGIRLDWELMKDNTEDTEVLLLSASCYFILIRTPTYFVYHIPERLAQLSLYSYLAKHLGRKIYNHAVGFFAATILAVTVYVWIATETCFLLLSEHACALFKIVGRMLKHVHEISFGKDCTSKRNGRIRSKICWAVRVHVKTIKFVNNVWDTFGYSYNVVIPVGIAALSMALLNLCNALRAMNFGLATMSIFVATSFLVYAVFGTICGQRVIDHSFNILYDAYCSSWYECPPEIQKFYILILQRATKHCTYSKKGIFVSSFEGLTSVKRDHARIIIHVSSNPASRKPASPFILDVQYDADAFYALPSSERISNRKNRRNASEKQTDS
ncbi:uncharacterized protein LOC117223913 isoform X2 [Megalopta genalis]|uniref:uncharacterized protein LOC117223913 isoform X2 n=1 Tax=Megalopta genalis TaxID=115081 RepID=UPI003FD6665B